MRRLRKFGLGDPADPSSFPDAADMIIFSDGSAIDNQANYYPPGAATPIPIQSAAVGSVKAVPSSWDHFTHWLGQPIATGWPITNGTAILGAAFLTAAFSRKGKR